MDHTVNIKHLHCGQHYNTIGALSLLLFSQKVLLGALSLLLSVPKVVGFGLIARINVIGSGWAAKYLNFFFLSL